MEDKKVVPVTVLGQTEDGKIYISKTTDNLYLIEDNMDIVVAEGISVSFLDTTKSKTIHLESCKNSTVYYTILDSINSNRDFKIHGELQIHEIALNKTKENLNLELVTENSSANVKCLCIASGMENSFTQMITHKNLFTTSNISNVAVSMNHSNVVFDTTGKIEKAMSGSKCQQLSRGIVMDDYSSVTAKPILLIDDYDCFANHGASIGKMSDEDLFYLMSRGLNKKEAFLLILQGIIQPFINAIPTSWRDRIEIEVSNLIEK